jgi:hypothetical protein
MPGNTGFKKFAELELYYLDDNSSLGVTKPNVDTDPDYIAPTYDSTNCVASTRYYNTIRSIVGVKNDCGSYIAGTVSLTVVANQFVSLISLEDANSLADTWLSQNIQDYANTNGTCTYTEPCGNWTSYINPLGTDYGENLISGYLDFGSISLPGETIDPTTNIRLVSYFTADGLSVGIPSSFYQENTYPNLGYDFQIGFEIYFNQGDLSAAHVLRFVGTIVTNLREIPIDIESFAADSQSGSGYSSKNNCNIVTTTPILTIRRRTQGVYTGVPEHAYVVSNTGYNTNYTFTYVGVNGTNYGPYANVPPINVGDYTVVATNGFSQGFNAATSNIVSFSILRGYPNLYIPQLEYTYNGTPQGPTIADKQLSYTYNTYLANGTAVSHYEVIPTNYIYTFTYSSYPLTQWLSSNLTLTYNPTSSRPTMPGTYKVTAYVAAHGNFNSATTQQDFKIKKLIPVVTPTIGTYVYNGTPQGPTTATNTGTGTKYDAWGPYYNGINGTNWGLGYGGQYSKPTNVGNYKVDIFVYPSNDGIWDIGKGTANFDIIPGLRVQIYPDGSTTQDYRYVNYFKVVVLTTNNSSPINIRITNPFNGQTIYNSALNNAPVIDTSYTNTVVYKFTSNELGYLFATVYYDLIVSQGNNSPSSVTRTILPLSGTSNNNG